MGNAKKNFKMSYKEFCFDAKNIKFLFWGKIIDIFIVIVYTIISR